MVTCNDTLYESIRKTAIKKLDSEAIYYLGASITYKKLLTDIDALSTWLAYSGIDRGDVVTICMPNIPQSVVCLYALSKLGAVAHMVHPLAPKIQLENYMNSVNSKMLIIPDLFLDRHKEIVDSGKPTLVCSPAHYLGIAKRTAYAVKMHSEISYAKKMPNVTKYSLAVKYQSKRLVGCGGEDDVVYLHSGGTSGEPKTIRLSSRAINSLCMCSKEILNEPNFNEGGMLATLPMFHGFGLAMGVHAMLMLGGTVVLMPKFNPEEVVKLIEKNKINYIIGVPILYETLLKTAGFNGDKLKNLRQSFVGGDFVPIRLIDEFNTLMKNNNSHARLYEGYGLTETVTVCCVNNSIHSNKGSVGKPNSSVEIACFNATERLGANVSGEICISGSQLMSGYLNDEKATNEVFFKDQDGKLWVRSGDVGYIDKEGYVFFKSRIKRIAKVRGITVFPSEIENLCMNEFSEIKEAHAVSAPDDELGSAIVMFICPKQIMDETQKAKLRENLTDFVESRLSVYARPRNIFFLSELPKTLIGKVDSNKLKEIYL